MSERADVVIPEAAVDAAAERWMDGDVYGDDDIAAIRIWMREALVAAVPLLGSEREGVEPMSYREGIKAAGHAMQPSLAILEKRALAAERERDEAVALLREIMRVESRAAIDAEDAVMCEADYQGAIDATRVFLSRLSDQETKR